MAFLQKQIPEDLIVEIGTRADGKIGSRKIKLKPLERRVVAWRYKHRLRRGQVLDAMTLPIADDDSIVAVIDTESSEKQYGVRDNLAMLTVVAGTGEVVGDETFIEATVTIDGNEIDVPIMVVEVIDPIQ